MDEARELLILARELLARPDIKSMYRQFNSRYFDSQLPDIPVEWGRSKVWAGVCKGTWNRATREGKVKEINLSTYIENADQDVIEGVLLHEMVHAISIVTGRYDGHGMMFSALLSQYGRAAGRNIPRTEKLSNFTVPEDVRTKPVGVVVYGKTGFMTYNWNAFRTSIDKIIERLEQYAARRHTDVTLLKVEDRGLMVYPEKRRFKVEWFPDRENIINRIYNEGKELARVTSGHPTQVFALA